MRRIITSRRAISFGRTEKLFLFLILVFLFYIFILPNINSTVHDYLQKREEYNSLVRVQESVKNLNPNLTLKELFDIFKVKQPEITQHPPDYLNPIYDEEAKNLIKDVDRNSKDPVDVSLLTMARSGHRHRYTDVIGGNHYGPTEHRELLKENAMIFSPFVSKIEPKSQRDFKDRPVSIREYTCDTDEVPCCPCKTRPYDGSTWLMTMENYQKCGPTPPHRFCGSPSLTSDIPLQYMSWHDFGIMRPITSKKTEFAAAYISNCVYLKRNQMVLDLGKFSQGKVHSFGKCVSSGHKEPFIEGGNTISKAQYKLKVLEKYLFSLAFENSEYPDYISEKYFGSLISGSVPVLITAPNIKFWGPDTTPYPYESNALIFSKDFGDDSERIAGLLLALSENEKAYNELLKWKTDGYSTDFKVLVDRTDTHSDCRTCIFVADDIRKDEGPNIYDVAVLKEVVNYDIDTFHFFVRQRGKYSFTRLGFPKRPSMRQLVEATLEYVEFVKPNLWLENQDLRNLPDMIYGFNLASRRARYAILSDGDLEVLPNGCELEVIFV